MAPLRPASLGARIRAPRVRAATAVGIGSIVWALGLGALVGQQRSVHLVLALAVIPLGFAVVSRSPRTTVMGLALWLVALGLVRRFVGSGGSVGGLGDPLLLVSPAVIVMLMLVATARGAFRPPSGLAGAVGLLSLLALIEAANPLQGSLLVGLGGLLFILVPMLAFWIGRAIVDDGTFARLQRLVSVLAVLSAIYGLVQQFAGFPSWDLRWIATSGYASLHVGTAVRAFGSFSSAQEYALFLSVGIVILVSQLQGAKRRWLPVQLAAIGLVGTALVLASVRGSIVLAAVGLGAISASRAGFKIPLALAVAALALVGLSFALGRVSESPSTSPAASASQSLIRHDVLGITSPTGKNSTLSVHVTEMLNGVKRAFVMPIGDGTGSVTLASSRLGGTTQSDNAQQSGTESDIGNVGVAFGLPGLVLYLMIVISGAWRAYWLASRRRDRLALAALGILIVAADQWMNGGLYSTAWLVWLALGWIDRTSSLNHLRSEEGVADGIEELVVRG